MSSSLCEGAVMRNGMWWVGLGVVLGGFTGCRPECEQPLSPYCEANPCLSFREQASLEPGDGGCFGLADCGAYRILSSSQFVSTEFFYDADGGMVAVRQNTDVQWECGEPVQTFGEVPSCTVTKRRTYCVR